MTSAAAGRRYDKEGNLKQWWTEATVSEYERRVQCIVEQYSQYSVSELGDNFTVSHCIRYCGAVQSVRCVGAGRQLHGESLH